jgi:acetylornithine deacetylase
MRIMKLCNSFVVSAALFLFSPVECTPAVLPTGQLSLHAPASDPLSKELDNVIKKSPMLTLHKSLCEIESISYNELSVAKFLTSYLEDHDFTLITQEVSQPANSESKKKRLNVIAYPKASKYGTDSWKPPKVLLSSHIDTVPPFLPYKLSYPSSSASLKREDVFIGGRGTVDAKACVATQIQATIDLLTNSIVDPTDIGLVFVVGEERAGDGMRHFSESKLNSEADYKAVIFGEPTELKLATGHKGIIMVTIKAHGKAAHSGYPWLGRSANSMIIPALMVMDALGNIPESEGGLPASEKYGNSTVNIGKMQGGLAANVVPEYAEAECAMRLAGGTIEQVKEIVGNAIKTADDDLEFEFSQGYGPVDMDGGVEGFEEITVNYGTDVPNLKVQDGVKRYLYGPGSILVAHGQNEGLTVGDLESAVEGYKKLVLHALGK